MKVEPKSPTPKASRPHSPRYGIVAENEGEGLLPWTWAAERLARARNYFLATTRRDGRPHLMVIWGLWLDDQFYFSTGASSQKAKNLAHNPMCAISVEGGEEAVIAEGVASELAESAAHDRFAVAYKAKYGWDMSERKEPVFVVRPRVVFGQIEATFTTSATRWTFES